MCFAEGEAVDRATRAVDRDIRGEVAKRMEAPPKKVPKPKEEIEAEPTGPKIYVSKIELTGTESFPPEDFQPILKKYEGRDVAQSELDDLTEEIQEEYLNRGIIAACFIPPQDVKKGVVVLRVVEAKMGELKIGDHPFFDKEQLEDYWTTRPGEVLRYYKMSHDVELMNTNPDRSVAITLLKGKEPGTTDVLLDVTTQYPIHVTASFDTEGNPETGRERKGIGIRDNNLLGVDDILMAGYIYGTYFSNKYIYHRVPITNFGTTVMYGYTYSKAAPKKDQQPLGIGSIARNSSVFVYQDLFHKAEYLGSANIGIEAKDKTVKWNWGTLDRNRFRIIRCGGTLMYRGLGGVTYFSPGISQGINGLGARRKNSLSSRRTTSNDGVSNTFTIFKMDVQHKRPLPFDLQANLKFKSQISSEKLASEEEFFLGGINSVRGYPAGDFMADTAFQTNVEILVPAFILPKELKVPYGERPLRDDISGVIFYDYAHARRRGVTDIQMGRGDRRVVNFSSIGVGFRARVANQMLLRFEWGYPVWGDKPISEFEPAGRIHISIDFEDKFFEEIERLQKEVREDFMKRKAWKLLDDEINRHGSLLGATLYEYLQLAQAAHKKGNLKEARKYYQKIFVAGNSLYEQAESYIKNCEEKVKELKQDNQDALRFCAAGDLEKAKELWQKIMAEAKIEPLKLVF